MPTLLLESPNQIASTAGRSPRVALADALRASAPLAVANREFAQQQRALELQEEAQARAQSQQTIGNVISGVGTVGQGALTLRQLGVFGGSTAGTVPASVAPEVAAGLAGEGAVFGATAASPAFSVGAGTGLAATEAAGAGAAAAGLGAAEGTSLAGAGTAAATTTGAVGAGAVPTAGLGGALAAAAPVAGIAGAGLVGGALVGPPVRRLAGGGIGGRVAGSAAGATLGAGVGALAGTVVFPGIGTAIGAGIGAAAGGLAGLCVIHEASYGKDSLEVAIARQFRDAYLTREQLRGYYWHFAPVAAKMHQEPAYRMQVRVALVDRLVRVGATCLGIPYAAPTPEDQRVTHAFLRRLTVLGKDLPPVRRPDGAII